MSRDDHLGGAGVRMPDTIPDVPLPESNAPETVSRWARMVMDSFGLCEWRFGYDRATRRLGCCNYRTMMISLSRHFVRMNGLPEIRQTLLHEIAHALSGPGHGHGRVWRAMANRVGCRPVRCGRAEMPAGKWRASCPGCSRGFHRHKSPKRMTGWHCRACGCERGKLTWRKEA
jgi:predicted SprT family Zn-dependent metalloprotease